MSTVVDVLVKAALPPPGARHEVIGYCRVMVEKCSSIQALIDEVATKCMLPHSLFKGARPLLNSESPLITLTSSL